MIINPRTVEIDVAPSNARECLRFVPDEPLVISDFSDAVTRWCGHRLANPAAWGMVDVGCLQAFTVSFVAPHIVFRILVDERTSDEDVERFRLMCVHGLTTELAKVVEARAVMFGTAA